MGLNKGLQVGLSKDHPTDLYEDMNDDMYIVKKNPHPSSYASSTVLPPYMVSMCFSW